MTYFGEVGRDRGSLGFICHLTIFGLLSSRTKRSRSERPSVCRRHLQSLAGTGAATQSSVNKHCALSVCLSVCPSASFTDVFPSAARWLRSAPLSLSASLLASSFTRCDFTSIVFLSVESCSFWLSRLPLVLGTPLWRVYSLPMSRPTICIHLNKFDFPYSVFVRN